MYKHMRSMLLTTRGASQRVRLCPFYAQRISNNIVMHDAQGILNGLTKARNKQLRAATGAA